MKTSSDAEQTTIDLQLIEQMQAGATESMQVVEVRRAKRVICARDSIREQSSFNFYFETEHF